VGKGKQKSMSRRGGNRSRVRPGFKRLLRNMLRSGRLVALILAAATGWIAYDALRSPHYRVQIVETLGAQALSRDDVAALADVQDEPIWYVDTDEIAARVRQSPYVEQAEARLILPDRVEVHITERKPEVRWMHDGQSYAVTWDALVVDLENHGAPASGAAALVTDTAALSNTGTISGTPPLNETTPLTPSEVLSATAEISGTQQVMENGIDNSFNSVVTIYDTTPNRPLKVGDRVDSDALELARRVILRAPMELPRPIKRIEWDAGLGVSLIVDDDRQVVLGKSDDLDRKMATLRFLMHDSTAYKYLDLRPTTPYYR
jgi:cell division protein FtsQ